MKHKYHDTFSVWDADISNCLSVVAVELVTNFFYYIENWANLIEFTLQGKKIRFSRFLVRGLMKYSQWEPKALRQMQNIT